jgi:hypothetical protein
MFGYKYKLIRNWHFLISREKFLKNKNHGLFNGRGLYLLCRSSVYDFWRKNYLSLGKGSLSRSEPLFLNPNPSFNSIGRASRERGIKTTLFKLGWKFEKIYLNSIETVNSLHKKNLDVFRINSHFFIKSNILKLEPELYWKSFIFKKYTSNLFFLKSGLKFGGKFLIYKNSKKFLDHIHSTNILSYEIFFAKELNCMNCSRNNVSPWLNIQNKVRLSQQVSKNFTISLYKENFKLVKNRFNTKIISSEFFIKRS